MPRLENRIAVITGAGSGIGAATAALFAEEGAKVAVVDQDLDSAERVVGKVREAGGEGIALFADVTSASDVQRMVDDLIANYGRLDILVNNAGISILGTVTELEEDDWDRVMEVNVKGSYLCSRAVIPHMESSGQGSIVCVASACGVIGLRNQVAYNVSKHGVIGLVRCMALDHASAGIRVNAVCPGTIRTPMLGELDDQKMAELEAMHPIGRIGTPIEVAQAILHLASDESSFTTGSAFLVDGGLTAI